MKILSLGANGAVGQLALDDLLKANHEVTALVRNPSAIPRKDPRLTVVRGEPTNAADLENVLDGQDVVAKRSRKHNFTDWAQWSSSIAAVSYRV
jgi:putative NADH-flavin reductase